jgi:hypothetical protein
MRTLSVLLLFLGAICCRAADTVTGDLKDSNSLVRLQILSSSMFNLTDMERVARRFLDGAAKSHTTAVLLVYADRTIASQEGAGCEGNYLQWKLLYDNFPKGALLAASVISLQGDAVLWLRTFDGSIFRRVLSGKDPTQISVGGVPLEILFVTARIRSRFEGCGTPGALDPVLYLRTSVALSDGLCERVTSWLATRLGAKHIWVELANVPWFPCDGRFPLRYPFSLPEPPPSEDTFYSFPAFSCTIFCDGKPSCASSTPLPRARRPEAH